MDGQSYSVTGQNQGNWNSAGGILGAASFFGINAGNILGRNGWGCNNDGYGCSDNTPVNRYELNLVTSLGAKDSEIALLKADKYTDQKIVEAVAYLQGEIGKVATKLENFNDAQNAVNLQQATYNATATANIGCIGQQVAQLQSMFNLVVPSNKVCDTCCNQ